MINTATWDLSLNTTCPDCKAYVDLLDYADFWDGRKLDICEHGTDRSQDVAVNCPECDCEFKVNLEF